MEHPKTSHKLTSPPRLRKSEKVDSNNSLYSGTEFLNEKKP